MGSTLKVPFKQKEEIRAITEEILERNQPGGGLPVNIEKIVEVYYGLGLTPIPGLKDIHGVDGSLSADLRDILVDEGIMVRVPTRFRYTLAHELAHLVLHANLIEDLDITSTQRWKEFIQDIDNKTYSKLEWQAHAFARYILVPTHALQDSWETAFREADKVGLDLYTMEEAAFSVVASNIAREFDVSEAVISIRLRDDENYFA
jgi:hypothetical protein